MRYQAKLVEHVSDAIIGLDAEGRIDSWNPAAEEMYGWTCDAVIGRKFADVVGADPRLGIESSKHLETVHRRSDGTLLEVRISVALRCSTRTTRSPARWPSAPTSPSAAAPRPRAARSRSATPRSSRRSRKGSSSATTRASSPPPTAPRRASSAGASWSASASTRCSARSCGPATPTASSSPTTSTRPCARCGPASRSPTSSSASSSPDREQRWLSVNSRPLRHDDLLPYGMVCSFSDVTERRRTERQLNYQATHDSLTGLANRPVFIESLRQTLDHARRGGSRVGVLFIDLDRFKVVNDTQGHLVGDEVLIAVARRLQQATRSVDTVARLSGDEFVVLCPDLADIESARRRATEIAEVIAAADPGVLRPRRRHHRERRCVVRRERPRRPRGDAARRRRRDVHRQGARSGPGRAARQHAARARATADRDRARPARRARQRRARGPLPADRGLRRRTASSASRHSPAGRTRTGRSPRTSSSRSPRSPGSSCRSASGC